MRLELERRILEVVKQHSRNGVIQSELWSILGVDNREGSRAVLSLMRKGLIRREQVIHKGRKTYVLKYTPEKLEKVNLKVNLNPVIKIPCFTCKELYKCGMGGFFNPYKCNLLTYFILNSSES
ncbi:MAG: Lrp/AsnC family transcriptional regulator [Zestosphaera sp.]